MPKQIRLSSVAEQGKADKKAGLVKKQVFYDSLRLKLLHFIALNSYVSFLVHKQKNAGKFLKQLIIHFRIDFHKQVFISITVIRKI